MYPRNTIERAFQLAPEAKSIEEIKAKLRREGHSDVDGHLSGLLIRTQLSRLLDRKGSALTGTAETNGTSRHLSS